MTLQYLDILIAFAAVMLGVSLLITVLTQILSAVLGLRGTNLRWGLRTLLMTAIDVPATGDVKAVKQCEKIADAILHHPLISDSTFSKFAGKLMGRVRLASAIRKEELIDILDTIGFPEGTEDAAQKLKDKLPEVQAHINSWFDTTMDRVAQRFSMSMRVYTVLFAVVLAAALQLDAVSLLRQLAQDQTVRARLVASADAVVRETSKILGATGETNVFVDSISQLRQREPDAARMLTNTPPQLLTLEAANLWVRTQLGDDPQARKVLAEYHQIASSNVVAKAPELMGSVAIVQDELARSGLQLLPDYPLRLRDYSPFNPRFWGMLLSVLLLSLGAPFWFNGLKRLLSLRPTLARRIQEEEEEEEERREKRPKR